VMVFTIKPITKLSPINAIPKVIAALNTSANLCPNATPRIISMIGIITEAPAPMIHVKKPNTKSRMSTMRR
jgi:hypothetical protein